MEPKQLVVHCLYTDNTKDLAELLEESFRSYLHRTFASYSKNYYTVHDEWPLISGGITCT